MPLISNSYAYEISVIHSLHVQNVCKMYHVYVSASTTAAYNSCERACRCVSDCPRAGRCVRHAQCVARAPHAYTCRTDRDLCHWLRSVHRRVYRRSTVPRVRIERTRTTRSARHHLSIHHATYRERDRWSFTPVNRRLLDQHGLLVVYESYETRHLKKKIRNFIKIS